VPDLLILTALGTVAALALRERRLVREGRPGPLTSAVQWGRSRIPARAETLSTAPSTSVVAEPADPPGVSGGSPFAEASQGRLPGEVPHDQEPAGILRDPALPPPRRARLGRGVGQHAFPSIRIAGWPTVPTLFSGATWPRLRFGLMTLVGLETSLFVLGLGVYAATHLWGLEGFPIYFFTDEAINPVLAEQLIQNGLHNSSGDFLPLYFDRVAGRWIPLLSMYVHIPFVLFFGKSVFVARATSALFSLLAAVAIALTLKIVFKARFWWAAVPLLAVTPTWFLHSRTAFEWIIAVAFFACFLFSYLLYRVRSPKYLAAAVLFAAASFYTYAGTEVATAGVVLVLLVFDARYHLQQLDHVRRWRWRSWAAALALVAFVSFPFVGFSLKHSGGLESHLAAIDSYLVKPISITEKLGNFAQRQLYALSPQYWIRPDAEGLERHRIPGSGHLPALMLPFMLVGFGVCLVQLRSPVHRVVLLTTLAAPLAAALTDVGISRVIVLLVPFTILACLGLGATFSVVGRWLSFPIVAVGTFVFASLASLLLARAAVLDGPLWYRDYGLYGMQWGARQLFGDQIPRMLALDPRARVFVSPTWANDPTQFPLFFLTPAERERAQLGNVQPYMSERQTLNDDMVFIMTAPEYQSAVESRKFKSVAVERILFYPDGSPGFYFARLTYVDNLDEILVAEREERRQLVDTPAVVDGEGIIVRHSRLDMGSIQGMFDGDRFTLARVMEANPAIFELVFPSPRVVSGIAAEFSTMDIGWVIELYPNEGAEPTVYRAEFSNNPPARHLEMFGQGPISVTRMRLEVRDLKAGETSKVHVYELKLL
jgi:hypothetical protein